MPITEILPAGDLRILDVVAYVPGTDDDEPIEGGLVIGLSLDGLFDVAVTYDTSGGPFTESYPLHRSLLVTRKG